jgi:hypothetical protein
VGAVSLGRVLVFVEESRRKNYGGLKLGLATRCCDG